MSSAAERNARAVAENFAGTALDEGNPDARELWQKYKDVDWPEDTTPLEKIIGDVPRYGKDGIERIILRTLAAKSKEAASDTRAEPERASAPPARKTKPSSKKEINAKLRELAAKLKYEIEGDGSSLIPPKRVGFRNAQRNFDAQLRLDREAAQQRITARGQQATHIVQIAQQISKAVKRGDWDAVAKLSGRAQDWTELQGDLIGQFADRGYHEVKRMRAEQAAERAAREAERRREIEAEKSRVTAEKRAAYLARLKAQMASSSDPFVREFADDEDLVGWVERVQLEKWNDDRRSTVSPEQAFDLPVGAFGGRSLRDYLGELRPRLEQAFGDGSSAPDKPGASQSSDQHDGPDPEKNPAEFTKHWISKISESVAEDREAGRGLGG